MRLSPRHFGERVKLADRWDGFQSLSTIEAGVSQPSSVSAVEKSLAVSHGSGGDPCRRPTLSAHLYSGLTDEFHGSLGLISEKRSRRELPRA